jgi:hypothetical protein
MDPSATSWQPEETALFQVMQQHLLTFERRVVDEIAELDDKGRTGLFIASEKTTPASWLRWARWC